MEIRIETHIAAPPEICFDLARDLKVHTQTSSNTRETIIAGPPSGLVERNDVVTFEATHFGIRQRLTSKIIEFDRPTRFADEMVSGAFRSLIHVHSFVPRPGGTLMIDELNIVAPFGVLGIFAELLFLKRYMTTFLANRAEGLKLLAESVTAAYSSA